MRELSLNVLDIAQNSISAGASLITISLSENTRENRLIIEIADNGRGMDERQLSRVTDPFYTTRTTRDVGMGVPLFKMAAEMTGGTFEIDSVPNEGTRLKAVFLPRHVDCMPVGDMCSTVVMLISMNTQLDFIYTEAVGSESFTLDTRELKQTLDGVALNDPEVVGWLTEYFTQQTKKIHGGAVNEDD